MLGFKGEITVAQSILEAVTNMPAIAQNVVGGAVFALSLYLGQRLYRYSSVRLGTFNKRRRIEHLWNECAKLHVLSGKTFEHKSAFVSMLIYRSLRSFAKAFIWLVLGLLCGSFGAPFGVAGYIGALYYFFSGLNALRTPEETDDPVAKLAELSAELEALNAQLKPNNSSKPTPLRGAA